MSAGFDTLKALLSRMREDGKFSDLAVKCQSSTFHVHCCIVCPQSPFFDKAANGNFEESESRVINIHDDPFIVSKLFDFLYRADYDDSPDDTDDPAADNESAANEEGILPTERISQDALSRQWRRAQTNVQIYIIADKYMIEGLKDISKRKLNSNMENNWDDCGFLTVVSDVYGSQCPPRSDLREIIIRFALRHLGTLQKFRQFDDARKEYPEFVYELSTALIERVVELEKRTW
ncbi:BTB/POZ domain-containing protein [Aspergillus luchuensis]|uniref:BTB domain-containing protein n=1 Tax=Aspergillus kawachii TaxID=1069201 RepID=A0A7R7W895_ASPKA|nr:uncharacterized protein AKAW2_31536S [Aspergillus luchuensis]BCR98217.1 hypothetical protein AKAW2_31536S [Aspergillus luchuensis]